MTTLALLLIIPLFWPIVAKLLWKHEITFGELGINVAAGVAVVLVGWALGRHLQTADYEMMNGEVTQKYSEHVSCEHSYSCHCREVCSGTGQNKSCSTTCDTCYEHFYDVDWVLGTSVGKIKIDRVDRQGTATPPRYMRALVGDPVARSHEFTNYIKAAPDSLFNAMAEKQLKEQYAGKLPEYPGQVYDYHYANRVLSVGVGIPDIAAWNQDLAMYLRKLGPLKQANVIVVFVNDSNPQFAQALRAQWLGGKKNDVVVVVGTTAYPKIDWVTVFSWTDKEIFKVQLRDALLDLKTAERGPMLKVINDQVLAGFVRKPMADFAYLKDMIEPPSWVLYLLVGLSLIVSIGTSVYLSRNDTCSGPGRYTRFKAIR